MLKNKTNDTLAEYASLFHMERMITLDERISLLKKLHTLYGTNYLHRVPEERDGCDKFEITLCHLRKISCKEKEIIKEFKNLWTIINKVWPQYRGLADNNVKILHHLISNHTSTHPNFIELIKTYSLLHLVPARWNVPIVNFQKFSTRIEIFKKCPQWKCCT